MFDYKNILDALFEKVERMRTERPSAGTRYRLMGMVADIMEVAETLQKEVLSWELTIKNDALQEPTQQVNDALGGLSDVLTQIGSQLSRRHKDEE